MTDTASSADPSRAVTAAVLLLSGMTIMANATLSPSLPALRAHFADVPGIETLAGLVVTLPSLAVVLTAGAFGWLTDRVDRQALLLLSGFLYAVGGTSGLWVQDLFGILIGRLVLGIGVAGAMVLATTWAADLWHGEARTRFLGLQGAFMSAGGIVVIMIGGALSSLQWRGAFMTYLLVVPITVFALAALMPHARERRHRQSPRPADLASHPFPWTLFAFAGAQAMLFMIAFYVIPTRLPFLLGGVGVAKPIVLSSIVALVTVAALPGALAYGHLRRRLSTLSVFALCWSIMGLGLLVLSMATNMAVMVLGVSLVGMGLGPAMPNQTSHLMAAMPPTQRGRASGLLTMAVFAGQFVSPLFSGTLVEGLGEDGALRVLGIVQIGLALGLAVTVMYRARNPATQHPI